MTTDCAVALRSWEPESDRYTIDVILVDYTGYMPGLPHTIGEALRNWLSKGWEAEVLGVVHRPETMSDMGWSEMVGKLYDTWCDHHKDGGFNVC